MEYVESPLQPLFELCPPQRAMESLVVSQPVSSDVAQAVGRVLEVPEFASRPALEAALWLERRHAGQPQDLVAMQRREWQTLFEWSLELG